MTTTPQTPLIPSNTHFHDFCADLQNDSAWAWSWYCNLVMLCYDAGATAEEAKEHAASFMLRTFAIDVRKFNEWNY